MSFNSWRNFVGTFLPLIWEQKSGLQSAHLINISFSSSSSFKVFAACILSRHNGVLALEVRGSTISRYPTRPRTGFEWDGRRWTEIPDYWQIAGVTMWCRRWCDVFPGLRAVQWLWWLARRNTEWISGIGNVFGRRGIMGVRRTVILDTPWSHDRWFNVVFFQLDGFLSVTNLTWPVPTVVSLRCIYFPSNCMRIVKELLTIC